jgi:cytochrome bd-type quinol oxidase subunit 2
MLGVLKLGHAEFEAQNVERMAEFYSNVIGLTETGRDGQTIYLSTSIDHHSIVLRGSAAPHSCLAFMFWEAGIVVFPLMLFYSAISYGVVHGKVKPSEDHY